MKYRLTPRILALFLSFTLFLSPPAIALRISQKNTGLEELQRILAQVAGLETQLLFRYRFYASERSFAADKIRGAFSNRLESFLNKWMEPQTADLFLNPFTDAEKALKEALFNMLISGQGGYFQVYRLHRKGNSTDGIAFVLSDRGPGIKNPNEVLRRSISSHKREGIMAQGKGFLNIARFPGRVVLRSQGHEWAVKRSRSGQYPRFILRGNSTVLKGTEIHFIIDDFPGYLRDRSIWQVPFSKGNSPVTYVPPATGLEEKTQAIPISYIPTGGLEEWFKIDPGREWLDRLA